MAENLEKKEPHTERRLTLRRILSYENTIRAIIVVAIIAVFAVMTKGLSLSPKNVTNVLVQSSITGVASIGQALVVLSGGIDISIGGLAVLTTVLGASLITSDQEWLLFGTQLSIYSGMFIMLLLGIGIGAINGLGVSRIRMPALIVTIAMWQITDGIAYQISEGIPIGELPDSLAIIGRGVVGGIPVPVIILVLVVVVYYFIIHHTTYGKCVYAVGSGPLAAWLSGVDISKVQLSAYIFSGFLASLAGLIIMARSMVGSAIVKTGLELETVAAVAMGGVSFYGGRGTVIGVVLGIMLMGIVSNGMNLIGLAPGYRDIVRGAIICLAVMADVLRRH